MKTMNNSNWITDPKGNRITNKDVSERIEKNNFKINEMKKIQSAAESLYEDDGGRLYTWKDIQKDIDDWVKDSSFREMFELEDGKLDETYYDYFEKDQKTPKYYKIYKDFWDISSNGAISEIEGTEEKWNEYNEMWNINSAKGNNIIKVNSSKKLIMSKTLSQSEREGMEVVLGIICGYYGADDDDKRYEIVKEQLSPEELNQLDEICTYVLADEQGHKTVSDRVLKDDIPLLRKVYNIIDDNDLFKNSQGDYDWDAMSGFEKICLTSSRRTNMKKTIKAARKISLMNKGNINSNRRTNMKIQSKRYIKSGTSNFGSNNDIFGYSFPLVTYIAENYMYDEETDSETEERDYDADDWEYRDAIDNAKDLADEMGIPQYDDYSEPYLCYEPFMIKLRDGYYEGLWIEVKEGTDETPYDENGEYQGNLNWKPFTEEQMNKYAAKINEYLNRLCSDYGWIKLGVTGSFSNGETIYHKIDNSRKAIKSSKTVADVERELLIDWHDIRPVFEENGYTLEDARNFERMTWEEALPTIKSIPELEMMFEEEIESSRKPMKSGKYIKSGMSYQQALNEFTANGKPWGDYWSMQYDWTMFVDSLERDDLVDYEEARWWDNPCTPETFREWKNS